MKHVVSQMDQRIEVLLNICFDPFKDKKKKDYSVCLIFILNQIVFTR